MTHLVHPFALENLTSVLNHIRRYRISLHRAPDSEENFLARNVLTDLIDYCPVKLGEFIALLEDIKTEVSKLDGEQVAGNYPLLCLIDIPPPYSHNSQPGIGVMSANSACPNMLRANHQENYSVRNVTR